MVDYRKFIDAVCDDGIAAAKTDYASNPNKLEGALLGFAEAKAASNVSELAQLYKAARARSFTESGEKYWYWRCREAEIEWVCNVYSAVLVDEGFVPIVQPTVRGLVAAAKVLEKVDG